MNHRLILSLAGAVSLTLAGCQETKPTEQAAAFGTCTPNSPTVRAATDVKGTLFYDAPSKQYRIQAPQEGTVDVVEVGVVCGTLPAKWQAAGQKVIFSGNYKEYPNPPSAPAGTTYYALELTKLEAQ